MLAPQDRKRLEAALEDRLQRQVPLARYTSARIGGPAEYLVEVRSSADLADVASELWRMGIPFRVLGGGSNVLVSDEGVLGVVVINQARGVKFQLDLKPPRVKAESGAVFGSVARRAVDRGLSGLEWAATIPGTVGGAVVNNAGAHGSDTAGQLMLAEILQHENGLESWTPDQFNYGYRSSRVKANPGWAVVLNATFRLEILSEVRTKEKMQQFVDHRRKTQPTGASWGSMFKNPSGDFAGRLIEAAGLKGLRVGQAQVSQHHANFFINLGGASATDVWQLLRQVKKAVKEKFGTELELEIERIGKWPSNSANQNSAQGAA